MWREENVVLRRIQNGEALDLSNKHVRTIFGRNVKALLRQGEEMPDPDFVKEFSTALGQKTNTLVYQICSGTAKLNRNVVNTIASFFGKDKTWFFRKHKRTELGPLRYRSRDKHNHCIPVLSRKAFA
jgi:hypothetical protein